MQGSLNIKLGWRPDMQDESLTKLDITHPNPKVRNSLFAVFDGHGSNDLIL